MAGEEETEDRTIALARTENEWRKEAFFSALDERTISGATASAEGGGGDPQLTGRGHFLTMEAFGMTKVTRKRSRSSDCAGTTTEAAVAVVANITDSSNIIGGTPPPPPRAQSHH